jgi:TolB-like protein
MARWIALLLLAAVPVAPRAAGRVKIAVMDVRNVQGVAEGTATILTDIVVSDVARAGHDVISKGDIAAMIGFEKQKQVLGCAEETSCLAEIGGALGVDFMLTGQVGQIGSQYRISLLLVDSRKARVAARAAEFCEKNEDALVQAAQRTVSQILAAAAPARPPPAPEAQAGKEAAPASATEPAPARRARVDHTKAWIAFGASGALALGGTLLGASAKKQYDDLKKLQGQPGFAAEWDSKRKKIQRAAGGADVLWVSAVLAAGAGTWLWVVENRQVALGPAVGPASAGLALSGSF